MQARVDTETGEIFETDALDGDALWRKAIKDKLGIADDAAAPLLRKLGDALPAHDIVAKYGPVGAMPCGCNETDAQGRFVAAHTCCRCGDARWVRTLMSVTAEYGDMAFAQRRPCPACTGGRR